MVVVGLAALGAGLGGYDWRWALIVIGAILLGFGIFAELRGR